jgi:gliding motility-associated-like protein
MKKLSLSLCCILIFYNVFAQKNNKESGFITCSDFHITKPLREIFANNNEDAKPNSKIMVDDDRDDNKPQKFPYAKKDPLHYGNDPATIQKEMGTVPGKAPIANFPGQFNNSYFPMDPSGAAGSNHYVQMINSTTFKVFNKTTGANMLTGTFGNLWSPATPNDGDPIVLYDKAADRWFMSQFGQTGNKMYIAISTTADPLGSWYTYTFTSPLFPDYLKFSVWQDGYYMTSNQSTQKVFAFERTQMLLGNAASRAVYQTYSPPNGGFFFVPLPGDVGDGTLPAAGTPCPIFSYSDNGWGAGFSDAVNIYKMTVNWLPATPTATIASAGSIPTAAFDATYDPSWNDVSQPGTTQKLDGIGGVCTFRAQYKSWSGYNTVVLNWGVKISGTQRSIKWCELRQDQTTGTWSLYQEGIYTPDAATRWLGSIAMDNNGSIALCYLKADATSIYPGLYYTGRRSCDPLGTLPVTEVVAKAGTGFQSTYNRDGDYSQTWLDPDGVTFWHTGLYMGGASGTSAAKTQIYSFQITPCTLTASVVITGTSTICAGASNTFTATPTNGGTTPSYQWKVNGVNVGTNITTYTTSALTNGQLVTCVMTSNLSGVTGSPATSNTITMVVNPIPTTPTASSNSPVCVNATINLTTPAVASVTYSWTGPNSFTSTLQNPSIASATAAMAGTYSVTVTKSGCTSLAGTTTVVTNTAPATPSAGSNSPVCIGTPISLTTPTLAGATYNWTGPNSFTSTLQNPGTAASTLAMAGTYSVTIAQGGCASAAGTVAVSVTSAPVAAFTASPLSTTCSGFVQFTDNSTGSATSWLWSFGDGQTSTSQSPSHTYSASGTYTVTLTATSSCGNNQLIKSNYVIINVPTTPAGTDGSRCGTGTVSLSATGSGVVHWFNAASGGTDLGTGSPFTTPSISSTTQYYAEDHIVQASQYVGPLTTTAAGIYSNTQYTLNFDCTTACTLVSVAVDKQNAASVTIQLTTSTGTVLQTGTFAIPAGASRVALNWPLPVGTGLKLVGPPNAGLWRLGTSAFPYTLAGLVSITSCTYVGTAGRYGSFFDWEIKPADCTSSRTIVTATVNSTLTPSVSIAASPTGSICAGTSVTFTATPTNGGTTPAYQWKVNGVNSGTNSATFSSSSLTNGQIVTCVLISNLSCASPTTITSNSITMAVTPSVTPSISIAETVGSNPTCAGTSVTFTATPTNGGTSPGYQWQVNGVNAGSNSATFTISSLTNGQIVTCILTSNAACLSSTTATSSGITMTVTPSATPSVSIAETIGSNPSCAGTSVTFTATPTNGGTTPAYQWQVNGVNAGTNSATFTSSSLTNGQIVTCILTSNASCASPTTATSAGITMTITATVVPAIAIAETTGSNPSCSGASVTFTATPTNGGSTPVYQWQVNGINAGTNSSTFTTSTLTNGQIVTCILTSNANCASPATATSAGITMVITGSVTPSVSIVETTGSNPTCSGSSVTFTATPTNGGTTPSYQWQVNGANAGTNSTTFTTSSLTNGQAVTCILTSNAACASSATATSAGITMTVTSTVTPSVSIAETTGSNPTCSGSSVTFTATPTNGGTTPSYQWQVNGTNTGTNSSAFTTSGLTNGQIVTCILTSNASCASPTTASSAGITMTVTSTVAPAVSIAETTGSNPTCSGASVTFTATPTSGGTTPAYQWQINGVNVGSTSATFTTSSLTNGQIVTCILTSNAACASPLTATSAGITMSVTTAVTPSVAISETTGSNPTCAGASVIFTATPTNGGTTPAYQWQVNGANTGTNSNTFTTSGLTNGQIVTCVLTSNATCASSATATSAGITMIVTSSVTPSVSIAETTGSNPTCSGSSVTFTATPTNGGTTPVYQWQLNGANVGANATVYSNSSLSNNDIVTCILTTNAACASPASATSNAITILVTTSVTPSVSIAASPNGSICTSTTVTFTATPANGGATPAYQWKLNGANVGANSTGYSNAGLANGDILTCIITSNAACVSPTTATSNAITMTVAASVAPTVSIISSPNGSICQGVNVTFTASSTNGGTTPAYQWKLNGANVGSNSTSYSNATLANNDIVTCILTSNSACASTPTVTSNAITMVVTATVTPSVSISALPNGSICAGASVTFTATPTNGGTTPAYQWKINGVDSGTNSSNYTNASLSNNDIVTCILTSNSSCASPTTGTSNPITMTVTTNVTPSVSIAASPSGSICSGTSVTFTATPFNGGSTPAYQWQVNGVNVGTNSSAYSNAALTNGDLVTCTLTSNATCISSTTAASNSIAMAVTTPLLPAVTISASPNGSICSGSNVTFTAIPSNGGTTPAYQWQLNGVNVGSNSTSYSNITLANNDVVTYILTSNAACISSSTVTSNAITMTVSGALTPAITILASPNGTVCSGTNVTFTSTVNNGGTTPAYQWQLNGTNVGSGSATYSNSGLANGNIVTCILTSNAECASPANATSNAIVMAVSTTVAPSISIAASPNGSVCAGTNVVFTATPGNGGSTPTYQWHVNGVNVGTNSTSYSNATLTNNDIVTCTLTSNANCVSTTTASSNAITMVITTSAVASVAISASPNGSICNGSNVTFTAVPANGGTTPAYQWQQNGVNVGSNSSTYSNATLANNDVITCILTSNATCVSTATATSNAITMTVSTSLVPSISILASPNGNICSGTNVTFTSAVNNGGTSPVYQWQLNGSNVGTNSSSYSNASLSNGDLVICVLTSNASCASPATASSNTITMAVTPTVAPSVSISGIPNGSICAGTNVSFTSVANNGGTSPAYQWQLNGINAGTNSTNYSNSTLANGDVVTCILLSNAVCASSTSSTSNAATMVVTNPVIPSITIAASPGGSICVGTNVVFTSTSSNGGPSPIYQWQLNGVSVGTNATSYSNATLTNGDIVTCVLTSNAVCASPAATSNVITIAVSPTVAPAVSITSSTSGSICSGTNVTFSAAPTNGGSTPSYQWQLNGANVGTDSSNYSTTALLNGDVVTCILTSNSACVSPASANSNAVTMAVSSAVAPTVSISSSLGGSICTGTNVTFTAMSSNGGSAPAYQWQLNGANVGTDSTNYSVASLANNDVVTCMLTSSSSCASPAIANSNAVLMTISSPVVPSISISGSPVGNICSGTSVSFTATAANGGSAPAYQWQLNGVNVGIDSTGYYNSSLANGDSITCVLTSNAACASPASILSNVLNMSVSTSVTPSISITKTPGGTVCAGTTITFNATAINSGTSPVYQWQVNGSNVGNNSPSFVSAALTNGDVVTCILTSNAICATSPTAISNSIPVTFSSIVLSASSTPISCAGGNNGTATIIASGGVPPYTYLWNDPSAQTSQTATILTAGNYFVTVTDNNGCSRVTTAIVSQPNPITLAFSVTNANCGINNGTASVTASGGTGAYTYLWNDASAQTTSTASVLSAGSYSVIVKDNNNCSQSGVVLVSSGSSISLTVSINKVNCKNGNDGSATVSVTGGFAPYFYLWSDAAAQTTSTASGLVAGTYNVKVTDNAGCAQIVSVIVYEPSALWVTPTATNTICGNSKGEIALTTMGGTQPYAYSWNTGQTSDALTNVKAGTYVVVVNDANSCSVRDTIIVTDSITEACLFIPNTFSPNGDGSHDLFVIEYLSSYHGVNVEIYNRWGNSVYSSPDYKNDWDGKRNGADLPGGVYYYIIDLNNGQKPVSGPLTILR